MMNAQEMPRRRTMWDECGAEITIGFKAIGVGILAATAAVEFCPAPAGVKLFTACASAVALYSCKRIFDHTKHVRKNTLSSRRNSLG